MPDRALRELEVLLGQLDRYLENHYSEADTRVKFIDPLLTGVLGWNEHLHIRREENYTGCDERRCVDYIMSLAEPILVVEAKKNLKRFEIPTAIERTDYAISGVMQNWNNAWEAICQAQRYCVDVGARYALVTNGHQYIAFKAVSERISWRKGHALVRGSPEILKRYFTLFYECLSKEAIAQDKLSTLAFPREEAPVRQKPRVVINVGNSGYRNELYSVLDGAFRAVLLDVPQTDPGFLRECYCSSRDAMRHSGHLNAVVADPLPIFRSPVQEVRPGDRRDAFDKAVGRSSNMSVGVPLFVVMGGIGVGKTTFLHWYFEEQMPREAKDKSVVIFCDFRTIDCTTDEVHARTQRLVIDGIINQTEKYTTEFEQLKEIFRVPIERELKGTLKPFISNPAERDRHISKLLEKYQDYGPEHLGALVDYLRSRIGKQVIVVLDNMDQKGPVLQDKLYQVGHELVHRCNLVVVVSIREATWRRMTLSASFNAFALREFHVKAQPIDLVLEKRLKFLSGRLAVKKVTMIAMDGKTLDVKDFDRFIQLLRRSLLSEGADPQILECIARISNGNIREQLQMIYSFMVSGQTKVDDYFWSYAKNKQAVIPFHEVLHSILYEDHKFFDEGAGRRFINVFGPAPKTRSGHFTALRILHYLQHGLGQRGDLRATDFVTVDDIFGEFCDYGWTREEVAFHLNRLMQFGLLLPESGEVSDTLRVEPCALSQAGVYYVEKLYRDFTYFSAMGCDTGIKDPSVYEDIAGLLQKHITAAKMPLDVRYKIGKRFVGYLDEQEKAEMEGAISAHPAIGKTRFVPRMIRALTRVKKNGEG